LSDALVTYCMEYSCCCVEKLSLVRKGVLIRVAGEVSDLSRGTSFILFGGWRGIGESGYNIWFCNIRVLYVPSNTTIY
jgi:hypothetical protein